MPYADGRTYYDADSHIMELDDWLTAYVEPELRDRFGGLYLGAAGALAHDAVREASERTLDDATLADLEARLLDVKGWHALGAFDPTERSPRPRPARLRAPAGVHDVRLVAVPGQRRPRGAAGRRPGAQPGHRRLLLAGRAAAAGRRSSRSATRRRRRPRWRRAWPTARPPSTSPTTRRAGVSHTHPDYDGVWGPLAEAGVPFVLHVGGSRLGVAKSLHDNGLPPVTDFIGGGENIRSKDYIALSHAARAVPGLHGDGRRVRPLPRAPRRRYRAGGRPGCRRCW